MATLVVRLSRSVTVREKVSITSQLSFSQCTIRAARTPVPPELIPVLLLPSYVTMGWLGQGSQPQFHLL